MDPGSQLEQMLADTSPVLALAPMQDVTDLAFLRLMTAYGALICILRIFSCPCNLDSGQGHS
jgi:tRNA-dihydrouridine synthase